MKRDEIAWTVAMLVTLVVIQAWAGAAAEPLTVTTGPTAVQVSNGLLEATLSADRLHLTGLRLAGGENLNLLQRVVTIYHTGQWQEEDSSPAYGRWETHLDRRPEGVVASAQTSDAFFVHRRTIQVRTGAPHLEVRYSWQCR
jgi:hypothetical protein